MKLQKLLGVGMVSSILLGTAASAEFQGLDYVITSVIGLGVLRVSPILNNSSIEIVLSIQGIQHLVNVLHVTVIPASVSQRPLFIVEFNVS